MGSPACTETRPLRPACVLAQFLVNAVSEILARGFRESAPEGRNVEQRRHAPRLGERWAHQLALKHVRFGLLAFEPDHGGLVHAPPLPLKPAVLATRSCIRRRRS